MGLAHRCALALDWHGTWPGGPLRAAAGRRPRLGPVRGPGGGLLLLLLLLLLLTIMMILLLLLLLLIIINKYYYY